MADEDPADARAGRATATFTPSPVDDTHALLTITFASGVSEKTGIQNMIAMGRPADIPTVVGWEVTDAWGSMLPVRRCLDGLQGQKVFAVE